MKEGGGETRRENYGARCADEGPPLHMARMALALRTNARVRSTVHHPRPSKMRQALGTDRKPYNHLHRRNGRVQANAVRPWIPGANAGTKSLAGMWRWGRTGQKSANCSTNNMENAPARPRKCAAKELGGNQGHELLTRTAAPAAHCRVQSQSLPPSPCARMRARGRSEGSAAWEA